MQVAHVKELKCDRIFHLTDLTQNGYSKPSLIESSHASRICSRECRDPQRKVGDIVNRELKGYNLLMTEAATA